MIQVVYDNALRRTLSSRIRKDRDRIPGHILIFTISRSLADGIPLEVELVQSAKAISNWPRNTFHNQRKLHSDLPESLVCSKIEYVVISSLCSSTAFSVAKMEIPEVNSALVRY